ncbi:MAG TPA: hypothetical protein GXZ95_01735 [Mollicutes bacterium]|nr:hypothetical protein [Mollicutes bacterium]
MKEVKIKEFRDGIFSLNTRRFGKVAELMIQKLYNFINPMNNAYDLLSSDNKRIEVKFSTVLKKCKSTISEDNLINQVISSNVDNRMLTFDMGKRIAFDCNIQQVKPKEFDILYYGCFFEDKIMICKIESSEISKDDKIFYSDFQHRGNVGEGQFHINNTTLNNHLEKYLVKWLTYEELFDLFN